MQCTAEAGSAEDGRSAVLRAPPGGGMARPSSRRCRGRQTSFKFENRPHRVTAAAPPPRVSGSPPVPHGTSHNARGHIIERTQNSTRLRGMDAMPATAKNTAPRTNERMKRHSHTQRGHTRVHTRHTPRATMGTCAACLPSRPRIQHQMSNGHGWVANPRGCGPAHDDSPGTTLLSSSFYTSAMLALFSIFTMRRCRTSWTTSGRAARAP